MNESYKVIGRFECDYFQDHMVIVKYNGSVSVMTMKDYNRIIRKEQMFTCKKRHRKYKKPRKNIERSRESA